MKKIIYAKHMLDVVVRKQLMRMVEWYVGIKTEFSITPGKFGKYVEQKQQLFCKKRKIRVQSLPQCFDWRTVWHNITEKKRLRSAAPSIYSPSP
jgi:aminoglycoside 6-adenylyltransferase